MAVVEPVFLDTSILLSGLIDFGTPSRAPMRVYDAVAGGKPARVSTAWHCCLEFYSVCTRLPMEFRLTTAEALFLLQEEVFSRIEILQLVEEGFAAFIESAAGERVTGGRIYDAHIAEVARTGGARIVVTDNQRHFTHLLKEEIRVLTAEQFVDLL